MKRQHTGIVYSTDHGEMCPSCTHPRPRCSCKTSNELPPGDGIVRIRLETKGRNGKAVTVITGLPLPGQELRELGRKLKQRCSTGGTVKDFTIELQGDRCDLVEQELTAQGFVIKKSR
jgi:translation initiation factor 1